MSASVRWLLGAQAGGLADWCEVAQVAEHLDRPTPLPGWTVRELLAHLSLGIGLSRGVTTAAPGAVPLSFGEYVRAYPPAADQIAADTVALAAELGADLVGGFRRTVAASLAHLDATPGEVLQARRGPVGRGDYVLTRLLELVVHADDLARALDRADLPLLSDAVEAVADALATAYGAPPPASGLAWVRLATGREPSTEPGLPLL